MPHPHTVTEYAVLARINRESAVRRLITGRIRGHWDPATGRWTVDAAELDALAAKSIDMVDVSPLAAPAEVTL